jgi:hypothetical protein
MMTMKISATSSKIFKKSNRDTIKKLKMVTQSKNGNTLMRFQNISIAWLVKPSQQRLIRTFITKR